MWIVYMFFKNIELYKKYKKHCALRKKEATEFITFGYSKSENYCFYIYKDDSEKSL